MEANYLQQITGGNNLSEAEAYAMMDNIARGNADPLAVAGILAALAAKGESVDEITGMVSAMRSHMRKLDGCSDAIDVCGTGGDGHNTLNISTITAFVCASLGVKVAKHGNRAASSRCGSFDVLEQLGARIACDAVAVKRCIDTANIGTLFAPLFHPAMKHVAPVRKALNIRTVFNFLGPLLNPAAVPYQLIGVSDRAKAEVLGESLMRLGSVRVIIVHGEDGMDELSIAAPSVMHVYEQGRPLSIERHVPERSFSVDDIRGGGPKENAERMVRILRGNGTPAERYAIELNAGAALYAAGVVADFAHGRSMARDALMSAQGFDVLQSYISCTRAYA